MRILIFSDNHGERYNIDRIIKQWIPLDRIISLGDSEMSENELSNLEIIGVKGNYPFEPKFPTELNFNFEGVNCFFTHGHHYHVKSGVSSLLQKAYLNKYDIVGFGHTHRVFLEEISGIIMIN
ncbi:MAG: YfcE family phosphodiesterase, partial [Candidatus Izemoplasmatales bacterium]